jgi:type III restriction enzyme
VKVNKGFETLRPTSFSAPAGEPARNFRAPVDDKQYIRGMLFDGFRKAVYTQVRFDSDTERRFAVILEDTDSVLKWLKPPREKIKIFYRYGRGEQSYEPDFIVETTTDKLMVETKMVSEMDDPDVHAKAEAAIVWCERASAHEQENGGKPWRYILIPHDAVLANATLKALVDRYARASGAIA